MPAVGVFPCKIITMALHIYDSATRSMREFTSLTPGKASIYLCGATVQGSPHIGHMRSALAFDVLVRWLRRCGYETTMVRNVTDIDDKILAKSAQEAGNFGRMPIFMKTSLVLLMTH